MRVVIMGAGPAGLYCAYLLKRRRPSAEIRVLEQNPANATFGFGVVFSDRALDFLAKDDPETHDHISAHMVTWKDLTVVHRDTIIPIDGMGFSGIGRLELLELLQDRVHDAGVEPEFETPVVDLRDFSDADLIVGADGANSVVRTECAGDLGSDIAYASNRFVWYGTTQPFQTLTQTFRQTEHGPFTAHHYPYKSDMSTFLVETDAATWERTGLAHMNDAESRAHCERIFAAELEGHGLVSNKSVWRSFPVISNERWSVDNRVLVGDALHTCHFSIGSGTRLAMEDVVALVKALEKHPGSIPDALKIYEANRRPVLETLIKAANASMRWYESMASHMSLEPYQFAHSYITRSGRISDERLAEIAPAFMRAYRAHV